MKLIECMTCKGEKVLGSNWNGDWIWCPQCKGKGEVPASDDGGNEGDRK